MPLVLIMIEGSIRLNPQLMTRSIHALGPSSIISGLTAYCTTTQLLRRCKICSALLSEITFHVKRWNGVRLITLGILKSTTTKKDTKENNVLSHLTSYNKTHKTTVAVQYILSYVHQWPWCEAYHPEVPIRSAPGLLVGTRQLQAHVLTACDTVQ